LEKKVSKNFLKKRFRVLKRIMCDHLAVDLKKTTKKNEYFRRILFTSRDLQLGVMSLKPGECIVQETYRSSTVFHFMEGQGVVELQDGTYHVGKGSAIAIPCGHCHTIKNAGKGPLKFAVVHAPPVHPPCLVEYTDECGTKKTLRK